ncbi:MAG TPA: MBL fold metallo-hydrolase [Thermomicrobiales bacterium]|nr:MBL fold metallo-hydrolase [Thermomicrobiales bacterium]
MRIETFPAGPLETNAYLVIDPVSSEAIVVDAPPDVSTLLLPAIKELGSKVRRIIITHGHWDHIAGLRELADALDVPVAVHPLVVERLTRPAPDLPVPVEPVEPWERLDEGDELSVGALRFRVMHLPGHDPGHIVLYAPSEGIVLGGDVLFPGGHGRTDIPGSDQATMDRSLARLAALPDAVTVYPGHGRPTTIGAERGWMPR